MCCDDRSVTNRSIVADKDLIGKDPIEHHLMTNIYTFTDIDPTPSVNDSPPALDKAKESHLIQNKPPYEFDRIPEFSEEAFIAIEIEYFLCGHICFR